MLGFYRELGLKQIKKLQVKLIKYLTKYKFISRLMGIRQSKFYSKKNF